ncbi:lipopolysaccharide transport periplasmic protein LptA [Marinimicrobium sp. ABcell2]|uniref:lipopolysaccharide transport periplasmic protein LptA n=1 Tax=Marinimicrobium sp. ABcell2 TaxID=3069751 RepID=UPI0027B2FA26|nr:lipopolysaccharide transport periplasmic protein LptA [Marinimicrobium sp. ABcell2]MDQ2078272.1 lipopolysaccharide transport periplasmic protein LptA [Marinimicrobium sp. ABcell2]
MINSKRGDTRQWLASFVTALCLALTAGTALALPEDRDQPIHIESDRATHDQRKGLTIYEGSVQLTQGSLRIVADRITVQTDGNNQVEWVEAVGSPAHFEQRPRADEELVTARAESVRYTAGPGQVRLLRNAWLEQDGATMSGNRIDYDMEQEIVKAEGETGTDRPRIEMVIPPQSRENRN